jgi:hypothetical protein
MSIGIFGIAGWLPVVSPSLTAEDLASLFEQNRVNILIGMSLLALSAAFYWPFSAAITMQMRRIEGKSHPLTYVQIVSSTGTVMAILLPSYFWLAAVFRPEVPAGTLQVFNDLSWLMFIGCYPPIFIQNLSIARVILTDKKQLKTYPRWVGFMNIWVPIIYLVLAVGLPFEKTGPLAWDGILGFWVVALCFFSWLFVMWWTTVKAVNSAAEED